MSGTSSQVQIVQMLSMVDFVVFLQKAKP